MRVASFSHAVKVFGSSVHRGELQTNAMRHSVSDQFSGALYLWPNGGVTAQMLRTALFQMHLRMNVPALASARRAGSSCAFHRCHA